MDGLIIQVDSLRGTVIPVRVVFSSRAKNFRLVGDYDGIRAIAPINSDMHTIKSFIYCKKTWVEKTNALFSKSQYDSNYSINRDSVVYLGKKYKTQFINDMNNNYVHVSDNLGLVTFHIEDKRKFKQSIMNWYRQETSRILSTRLVELNRKMDLNLSYNRIKVRYQKSRWGSCSGKRNLNFNLLLCALPLPVIDYVVIHELAHLLELNHSKKFWNIVKSADPQYIEHRQILSKCGSSLRSFFD